MSEAHVEIPDVLGFLVSEIPPYAGRLEKDDQCIKTG